MKNEKNDQNAIQDDRAIVIQDRKSDLSIPIVPVLDAESFKKTWQGYEALKNAICTDADIQNIQGKDFKKKSFWRKLETAFNIRIDFIKESTEQLKALIRRYKSVDRYGKEIEKFYVELYPIDYQINRSLTNDEKMITDICFSYVVRATAPNGVYTDADGHCSIWEKGRSNSYHNVKSTAYTRAKNRAISDLVGGGEVSADEINSDSETNDRRDSKPNQANPPKSQESHGSAESHKPQDQNQGKENPPDQGNGKEMQLLALKISPTETIPIGKFKGRKYPDLPTDYLIWLKGKCTDPDSVQKILEMKIDNRIIDLVQKNDISDSKIADILFTACGKDKISELNYEEKSSLVTFLEGEAVKKNGKK